MGKQAGLHFVQRIQPPAAFTQAHSLVPFTPLLKPPVQINLKMKNKLFVSTLFLLLLALLTNCNNELDKSTTGTLNNETNNNKTMDKSQLTSFGRKYSAAWCSQKPASVAAFFSTSGSLKLNADSPAVGRETITKVVEGFMTAF